MPTTDKEFNAIVTKLKEAFTAVHVVEGAEFEARKKGDQDLRAKRCRQMEHLQAVDLSLVDRLLKLRGESGSQKSRRTDACLGGLLQGVEEVECIGFHVHSAKVILDVDGVAVGTSVFWLWRINRTC